jgi:hypothetical protein
VGGGDIQRPTHLSPCHVGRAPSVRLRTFACPAPLSTVGSVHYLRVTTDCVHRCDHWSVTTESVGTPDEDRWGTSIRGKERLGGEIMEALH